MGDGGRFCVLNLLFWNYSVLSSGGCPQALATSCISLHSIWVSSKSKENPTCAFLSTSFGPKALRVQFRLDKSFSTISRGDKQLPISRRRRHCESIFFFILAQHGADDGRRTANDGTANDGTVNDGTANDGTRATDYCWCLPCSPGDNCPGREQQACREPATE